jgi:protease I
MAQRLKGCKIALLVTNGFEQIEMTAPRKELEQEGALVSLISPIKGKVKGWQHAEWGDDFTVDISLSAANPDEYDALVLPGGVMSPDALRINEDVLLFVKEVAKNRKPIAAICHGPWTLINAGLVKGHTMTSWPSLKLDLINAGAAWVDQEVVRDGLLITSRKPDDIPAFNRAMIELFATVCGGE